MLNDWLVWLFLEHCKLTGTCEELAIYSTMNRIRPCFFVNKTSGFPPLCSRVTQIRLAFMSYHELCMPEVNRLRGWVRKNKIIATQPRKIRHSKTRVQQMKYRASQCGADRTRNWIPNNYNNILSNLRTFKAFEEGSDRYTKYFFFITRIENSLWHTTK